MDQIFEGDLNWFNGVACIFWTGFSLVAIYRQKISYSRHGSVARSQSPGLFWLLVTASAAVAAWTGAAFILHRGA